MSTSLNRFIQQNVLTALFPPEGEVEVEVRPVDAAAPFLELPSQPNCCLPTGTLVAVANKKEGVGKTTSTINLGAALCEEGARVLLETWPVLLRDA